MRIRSIKPEFWRSTAVAELPREFRLLWIGLWSYVDDNGVGIDDYRLIAADLFALDDPVEAREFVREGLATLSRGLQITRYTLDGRSYLYVNGWDKHQRIDRPGKPRYPLPPTDLPPTPTDKTPGSDQSVPVAERGLAEPSRQSREALASGTEEQGNRGTGQKESSSRASARRRGTTTLVQLADSAVKPDARRIVDAWRNSQPDAAKYRPQTIREIGKVIDGLLRDGADPELVRAALDEWDRRPEVHRPGALPYVYDDVIKAARAAQKPAQPARSARGDKVRGYLGIDRDRSPQDAAQAVANIGDVIAPDFDAIFGGPQLKEITA
ncbi:hypothetical protein SAMN05421805_12770 [Saccharopolyspora antimicrobica]|uniref:Uncharacterized protein n=1 Tax=Saccharopolyspora antimicrobica TaxID=455193 RepID=A0A1I5KLD5_9PSEU|nr:hypothetical protein [Saccharopolyspora antimicrobica]RKT85627.1 hypothetical protein ATL45_3974 [Saccharopolyspora antimicrobica]SFO85849.1 hypothetical protein SAMN05421805_12770 [Saccharopolyspora antimicrobica]